MSRGHAFRVLGLDGNGDLRAIELPSRLRIERGGVWIKLAGGRQ